MSTDPRQDRKVDSLAGIRQSSSHGRVTHRDLRGQLASRVRALVLAGKAIPAAGSHTGIRESTWRAGSAPGQAMVLYQGDVVVGGGTIESTR